MLWLVRSHHYVLNKMDALENQVGGAHYKSLSYQPIELIAKLDLNFFQGNIVKYVSRYKGKNGKEDLMKALHYVELGCKLNPYSCCVFGDSAIKELHDYCEKNNFGSNISKILMQVFYQNWLSIAAEIAKLIKEYD